MSVSPAAELARPGPETWQNPVLPPGRSSLRTSHCPLGASTFQHGYHIKICVFQWQLFMQGFTGSSMGYLEVSLFSLMLLYSGHFLLGVRGLWVEKRNLHATILEWQGLEHAWHLKIPLFGLRIILSWRQLENRKHGKSSKNKACFSSLREILHL